MPARAKDMNFRVVAWVKKEYIKMVEHVRRMLVERKAKIICTSE